MAKQVGPLFFTGTVDDMIFYKLGDQYLMRSKGSYKSGKQMRKDPRYTRTLENAERFGRASKLVKRIYYFHLPRAVRKQGLYGTLTGLVNTWLYGGKSVEEVEQLLLAHCRQLAATVSQPAPAAMKVVEPKAKKQPVKTSAGVPQPATGNAKPTPTIAQQPTINTSQITSDTQPSVNEQVTSPNTDQRTTVNPQRSTFNDKRPRYLSRWKVKRNGRLHIPASADQPLVDRACVDEQSAFANRREGWLEGCYSFSPTSN